MRIGIIGAGHIGGTLAKLLAHSGHEVAVSNSRGPASLASLIASLGPEAHAETSEGAVRFGEVVVLAIPWRKKDQLPRGDLFTSKIVIDAMNPYNSFGQVTDLGERTSSEEVAKQMPKARLVKAFNTIFWRHLDTGSRPKAPMGDRQAIFIAGDDREAKGVVGKLIEDIGFAPIDTGPLREGGRRQQPGTRVYGQPLTAREARELFR
jgi:predicted dinucleotide-binding enzyme